MAVRYGEVSRIRLSVVQLIGHKFVQTRAVAATGDPRTGGVDVGPTLPGGISSRRWVIDRRRRLEDAIRLWPRGRGVGGAGPEAAPAR